MQPLTQLGDASGVRMRSDSLTFRELVVAPPVAASEQRTTRTSARAMPKSASSTSLHAQAPVAVSYREQQMRRGRGAPTSSTAAHGIAASYAPGPSRLQISAAAASSARCSSGVTRVTRSETSLSTVRLVDDIRLVFQSLVEEAHGVYRVKLAKQFARYQQKQMELDEMQATLERLAPTRRPAAREQSCAEGEHRHEEEQEEEAAAAAAAAREDSMFNAGGATPPFDVSYETKELAKQSYERVLQYYIEQVEANKRLLQQKQEECQRAKNKLNGLRLRMNVYKTLIRRNVDIPEARTRFNEMARLSAAHPHPATRSAVVSEERVPLTSDVTRGGIAVTAPRDAAAATSAVPSSEAKPIAAVQSERECKPPAASSAETPPATVADDSHHQQQQQQANGGDSGNCLLS